MKENYYGISWSRYVEEDLIPRLHGFELLMASYTMAHLKLDLLLQETKYQPIEERQKQRFRIYLTNSLEEHRADRSTVFAQYLSDESQQANLIKKNTPVMVVMGNPPYKGISSNDIDWINQKIEDYKYIAGEYFNERKHWLHDDYVKFIRYGEHLINKNGEGILAFINPHGFLDNPTFRGMRWHLLQTFDKIYTIDLHGNSKKKETAPDGSKDENVFDIKQGVSINLFIKTGNKRANQLAEVFHYDLYGKRQEKYEFLFSHSLADISFTKLPNTAPMYFMVPKNFDGEKKYNKGIALNELFTLYVTGIITMGDNFIIADTKEILKDRLQNFINEDYSEEWLKHNYSLGKNYAKFILKNKPDLTITESKLVEISYRPFDKKWTCFDNKLIWRWRGKIMQHFLRGENIGLIFRRQQPQSLNLYIFYSDKIIADGLIRSDNKGGESIAPLYLYPDENELGSNRIPNLDRAIVNQIEQQLELDFVLEKDTSTGSASTKTFAPIDLLDYIYAVLHSPGYREKYREFLKMDFPRVPYPNIKTFWQLVELGSQLRKIHLLEDTRLDERTIGTDGEGDDTITNKLNKDDWMVKNARISLAINDDISIINIPLVAWELYIGGYQPAQKWLKDRVGRKLSTPDFQHYNRIINALVYTDRLMQKIDKIKID